ncbi:MAG: cytochrome b5 domain-containing protein [bacterium]
MTKTTKEKAESATPKSYNMSQVAEHASKDSCWLVLDSKVYDVTPFVTSGFHPGKDAILEGCGKDATELFNTRPMGSGTSHSDKARGMLGKYYIGDISET